MMLKLAEERKNRHICIHLLGAVLASFLLLSACVSGPPVMLSASEPTRPAWVAKTPALSDGYVYYVGLASGHSSPEQAAAQAQADALGQLSREAGATISSNLTVSRESKETKKGAYLDVAIPPTPWTGGPIQGTVGAGLQLYDSSFEMQMEVEATGKTVTVQGLRVLGRYDETWKRNGMSTTDSWVLVGLPKRIHRQLMRRSQESTLLAVICLKDARGLCDRSTDGSLAAAAREGGIALMPQFAPRNMSTNVAVFADRQGADQVLEVMLDVTYQGDVEGEHFAYARGNFRLWERASGNTIEAGEVAKFKVGHTAKDKVLQSGVEELTEKLSQELRRLAQ